MIECLFENILDTSIITITIGSQNISFPLSRIYDRGVSKFFKASTASTLEIKIAQQGSIKDVNRFLIPNGHNMSGMNISLVCSDTDSNYVDAITPFVATSNVFKDLDLVTKGFWKFKITDPVTIPQFTELFLGKTYTWEKFPEVPVEMGTEFNVKNDMTTSGYDRFIKYGADKRYRVYNLALMSESQKDNVKLLDDAWGGKKPFWLKDHEGTWIYGKLKSPIQLTMTDYQVYSCKIDFIEVIS